VVLFPNRDPIFLILLWSPSVCNGVMTDFIARLGEFFRFTIISSLISAELKLALLWKISSTWDKSLWSLSHGSYWPTFLLVCDWVHFVGQNHFYVILFINQGCCLYSESTFQLCASRRFCADFKTEKLNPLYPSESSSVKQHLSGQRDLSIRIPINI